MLNQSKHQSILLSILKQIYSNPKLAPTLGFKGGTALYFCYALPRFSVDLDFDLLNPEEEEQVFNNIMQIAKSQGEIKIAENKKNSLHLVLSYRPNEPKIKIDISKRNFNAKYEPKNILGLVLNIMKKEDLFANKLIAASERYTTAIRDLYDINFMFSNQWDYNHKIIELRSGMTVIQYFQKLIEIIDNYRPTNILSEIGELLNSKDKQYVKEQLKSDLLFALNMQLKFL